MTKVAVSGASGFIGRYVVNELERHGLSPTLLYHRSDVVPGHRRHRIVMIDIHTASDDVFDRIGRPDVLVHLAWGGLPNYNAPRHVTEEASAHGHFLTRLVEGGLKRLLVTGTC